MLNCVNLYGFAQCQPLPWGNFRFIDSVNEVDWSTHAVDAPTGYIMECDVEILDSVHDQLSDLPPLPKQEIPPCEGSLTKKLIATLSNKSRYTAHYMVFQQAIRLGLKVT